MHLSLAIPDSSLADESTQLDKSRKVSIIARAAAIFGVQAIYVYEDGGPTRDRVLLLTILRYMETPAYLRKGLFPRIAELKYAGVLHPLNIASHNVTSDPDRVSAGDVRDGIVVSHRGRRFVDVGVGRPVTYHGRTAPGRRVSILFKTGFPDPQVRELRGEDEWKNRGYRVLERSLYGMISSWKGKVILTSRKGSPVSRSALREYAGGPDPVLVAFGSTSRGLHDILGDKMRRVQNCKALNFFPIQETETVRLEEAILGVLSILGSKLWDGR